jgi:hypothetical protein
VSHHLDSPASRRDGRLNVTDLYLFDGQDSTVLVMAVNSSLAGAARTPGFHPEARYDFRVHLDGRSVEEVVYRVTFSPADAVGTQALTLRRGDEVLVEGRTGEQLAGPGARVWAGAAADPFYLDLGQLGPVLEGLQHGRPIDLGDWTPARATSTFAGSEVGAIVLEVPTTDPELRPGRDIAVWAATELATDAGGWGQTNRAAIPMVWPLFRALGDQDDSAEYRRDTLAHPADDPANDGERIAELVAAAARPTGVSDPAAYGRAVAARLLPDLLPYRVGTPAWFGFAGFNGRALADNAPEVVFALVTNSAVPTGLTAATAATTRQDKFPYVVPVG